MTNTVTVKQIREVKGPTKLVANADVIINGIITLHNFKILRTEHNTFWVSNPQTEIKIKEKERYYDMLEFLDWELEQEVKSKILSTYQKILQSRTVVPEVTE